MIIGEVREFITLFLLLSCTFENFYNTKLFLKTLESVLQIKSRATAKKVLSIIDMLREQRDGILLNAQLVSEKIEKKWKREKRKRIRKQLQIWYSSPMCSEQSYLLWGAGNNCLLFSLDPFGPQLPRILILKSCLCCR